MKVCYTGVQKKTPVAKKKKSPLKKVTHLI